MDSFDTTTFESMSIEKLKEVEKQLLNLRKTRTKEYIIPQQKQHLKPLIDKFIKPLRIKHLQQINHTLRILRQHLPSSKNRYFRFQDKIYGPMSKKQFNALVTEVPQPTKP